MYSLYPNTPIILVTYSRYIKSKYHLLTDRWISKTIQRTHLKFEKIVVPLKLVTCVFERFRCGVRTPKIKHASTYDHVHTWEKNHASKSFKTRRFNFGRFGRGTSKIKHCIFHVVFILGICDVAFCSVSAFNQFIWLSDIDLLYNTYHLKLIKFYKLLLYYNVTKLSNDGSDIRKYLKNSFGYCLNAEIVTLNWPSLGHLRFNGCTHHWRLIIIFFPPYVVAIFYTMYKLSKLLPYHLMHLYLICLTLF
jgi:hypothetical protein